MKTCKFCGSTGDSFGLLEIRDYDWDSDDDDALSVSRVVGHRCANVSDCARRIVEQGTNVEGLRMVAADRENMGDLADQARQILREMSELAQQIARSQDLAAREAGWGAIGGPAY
jgi:hypothetical protein